MFTNVLRLEFAKQRKGFLSVIVFGGIFLLFVFAESLINNRNIIEVLLDIVGFFALIGMPALLILTGPAAAAQLRSESIRGAEEPLPFSPIQRIFGAYLTNLIYLLIAFVFLFGLTLLFHPLHDADLSFSRSDIGENVFAIIFLALQFHLLAFLFAYWINQPFLGTALAGLIVGAEVLILLLVRTLNQQYWFTIHESSLASLMLSTIILGIMGGTVGLWIITKRVELNVRTFFWPGVTSAIAISIGILIMGSGFSIISYRLQNTLIPANLAWPHKLVESTAMKKGMFFYSVSDDIVLVTPENKTVLRNTSFKVNPFSEQDLIRYDLSKETSFFLFRSTLGKYEIWKTSPNGKFEIYCKFLSAAVEPEFMFQRDDGISLYSFSSNQNFILFSKVTEASNNKALQWERIAIPNGSRGFPTILDHVLKDAAEQGRAARLSSSKKVLTRVLPDKTVLEWNLPGVAILPKFLGRTVQPAYEKDGQPHFVIPVNESGKISFVICSPDGSVRPAWNESMPSSDNDLSPQTLAGGGVVWIRWSVKTTELRVIGKDGTLYQSAKIGINPADEWPVPLTMDHSLIWVWLGKRLIKVDLDTGKTVFNSGTLTDTANYWNTYSMTPTKEGLYIIRKNRICLIDWNGKIRDLGSASVN